MTKLKSILITLQESPKICLSREKLSDLSLILNNKILSPPKFPLWATCADLLVSSENEFIGLCYYVAEDSKDLVNSLVKTLDPIVAQYVNSLTDKDAKPYLNCNLLPNHFQIKWFPVEADNIEVAQLDSDYWYYCEDNNGKHQLMAIGLNYIDEILSDYNLKFPIITHLNLFDPIFVP